jgi:hypothetical protein
VKVFIVNATGHDFSPSEKFGTPYFLTQGSGDRFNVDRLSLQMERVLQKEATKDDYLLLSGSMVYNSLAFYLWMKHFGVCKLLIWSPMAQDYVLRTYRGGSANERV